MTILNFKVAESIYQKLLAAEAKGAIEVTDTEISFLEDLIPFLDVDFKVISNDENEKQRTLISGSFKHYWSNESRTPS